MRHWYYSVDRQPPAGPVAEAELRRRLADGGLPAATLVWHEGMAGWQRADHPGLELTRPLPAPPPLPILSAAATAPQVHNPAAAAGRAGPGRTTLLLVLGSCAVVVLLVTLAVLAAVAVPAYQQYVQLSRTAAVLAAVEPLQAEVQAATTANGACPDNSSARLAQPLATARASEGIARVELVTAVNGNCGIAIQLEGLHRDQDKRPAMLWLEHNGGGDWICRSTLRDNQLPRHCRAASNIDKS